MAYYSFIDNFNSMFSSGSFMNPFGGSCGIMPFNFGNFKFSPLPSLWNNFGISNNVMPNFTGFFSSPMLFNNNIWSNIQSPPQIGDFFTFSSFNAQNAIRPSLTTFSSSVSVSKPSNTSKASEVSYTGSLKDYNPTAGKKLAETALENACYIANKKTKTLTSMRKPQNKFTESCAMYVKMAIRDSGLGGYVYGHAYEMKNILRNNPNFKEISPNSVNVHDLPEGCILVFDKGKSGYSREYGHTEIITADGRGVSDGISRNLRKPSSIFIPV